MVTGLNIWVTFFPAKVLSFPKMSTSIHGPIWSGCQRRLLYASGPLGVNFCKAPLSMLKQNISLKSTQLVTRSEELVATVLKIYQQSEIAKPTGRAKWYAHTLHKKKSSCAGKTNANAKDKISCARAGVNEVRMCRSKCDARAQVKMRSPCAGQNAMRMRSSKWGAHAQAKKRCARAGQNEMRMRRTKWGAHAQEKMRCA